MALALTGFFLNCPIAPAASQDRSIDPFGRLQTLGGEQVSGAKARILSLSRRSITLDEIAATVSGNNLSNRASAEAVKVSEALVDQRDAVFDPTVFAGLSYTNSFTKARKEDVGRERDQDVLQLNDEEKARIAEENAERAANGEPPVDPNNARFLCFPVEVDGQTFPPQGGGVDIDGDGDQDLQINSEDCFLPPAFSVEPENASFESRSTHNATGALGAGLTFPFGGSAAINLSSTWRKPAFAGTGGAPSLTSAAFPTGLTLDPFGWNDKPFWTSQFEVSAEMPLPFTRNFGYEGSPNYFSLEVARSGARRSSFTERSVRNASLTRALLAYWDLVQNVEDLKTFQLLREVLVQRQASQRRQFDAGLLTEYDVEQIDVELANLQSEEEISWNFLIVNSNRILTELGQRERVIFVPSDEQERLDRRHEVDEAMAFRTALETNPDIKVAEEDHDLSETTVTFRQNQDLPDVTLSASFGVGQTDAVFGYASLWNSLGNLVRPDSSEVFVGVRYTVPLGMNATEAQLARARVQEQQAFDRERQIRQQVVNAVDRAISDLLTTAAVVRQSEQDLRLAQLAYEAAQIQRDEGLVSEFEVLNRYSDLLSARRTRSAAQVSHQKSFVQLLSAQGILEQEYVR